MYALPLLLRSSAPPTAVAHRPRAAPCPLLAHQKSVRELDRERTKLQKQEAKLVIDIKKAAKAGQMVRCAWPSGAARTLCRPP